MKLKQNKIIQKIAILLVLITSFSFIMPACTSNASVGGALSKPFKALLVLLGDGVQKVIEFSMNNQHLDDTDIIAQNALKSKADGNVFDDIGDNSISLPQLEITPETIFSGKLTLLNINFIDEISQSRENDEDIVEAMNNLRKAIASWYVAIRSLALVAMLSILVYVGIRIIISSAASDKAKYKQMLKDWVIGICLLFVLHYIMAFTLHFTEIVTNMIAPAATFVPVDEEYKLEVNESKLDKKGGPKKIYFCTDPHNASTYDGKLHTVQNVTCLARLYTQLRDGAGWGYTIIYLGMVAITVIYLWKYIKRVIMMAFLTVIAPLVAMTYPIDKMHDGKAQAFNTWLRQYIFTALIQPFHLLIYAVIAGISVDLAAKNPIFAIVAFAFILSAEKLIGKLFGMDAKNPLGSAMGSFAGGALAANMAGKAMGALKGRSRSNTSNTTSNTSTNTSSSSTSIRQADISALGSGDANSQDGTGSDGVPSGGNNNNSNDNLDDTGRAWQDYMDSHPPEGGGQPQLSQGSQNSSSQEQLGGSGADRTYNPPAIPPSNEVGNGQEELPSPSNGSTGNKRNLKNAARNIGHTALKGARKLPRALLTAGGGYAGAVAGFAIGAAKSGSITGAFAGAAAGGAAGAKLGGTIADNAPKLGKIPSGIVNMGQDAADSLFAENAQDARERRKQREEQRAQQQRLSDKEFQNFFEEKTGNKAEIRSSDEKKNNVEMTDYENAADYKAYGLDNDKAIKAMEYEKELVGAGMSKDTAHLLTAYAGQYMNENGTKNSDFGDDKYIEKLTKNVHQNLGSGISKEEKDRYTKAVINAQKRMLKK